MNAGGRRYERKWPRDTERCETDMEPGEVSVVVALLYVTVVSGYRYGVREE